MPETVLAAGDYTQDEANVVAEVTPGELVEEVANGIQPHSTAAGASAAFFAREHPETGRRIDDPYPVDDYGKYIRPTPGSRVRARLAAGNTYTGGETDLVSAGDGTLRPLDTAGGDDAGNVVATAYEDADTTDGNVGLAQVRVR